MPITALCPHCGYTARGCGSVQEAADALKYDHGCDKDPMEQRAEVAE